MNWKSLIQDLLSVGWTQVRIAAEVGVKQPTIAGLLNGNQADVRWATGEKLRALHTRECAAQEVAETEQQLAQAGEGATHE